MSNNYIKKKFIKLEQLDLLHIIYAGKDGQNMKNILGIHILILEELEM